MKTLKDKPLSVRSVSKKENGAASCIAKREIKLRIVSSTEREKLRIPSYDYILP